MTIDDYDFEKILPDTPENLFWVVRNSYSIGLYHLVLMKKKKSWWGGSYNKEIGHELFGTSWPYDKDTPVRLANNLLQKYTDSKPTYIVVEKHS